MNTPHKHKKGIEKNGFIYGVIDPEEYVVPSFRDKYEDYQPRNIGDETQR